MYLRYETWKGGVSRRKKGELESCVCVSIRELVPPRLHCLITDRIVFWFCVTHWSSLRDVTRIMPLKLILFTFQYIVEDVVWQYLVWKEP